MADMTIFDCWEPPVLQTMQAAGFKVLPTMNKKDMIEAAAEFTRNRLEQIRQVEEEILWIKRTIKLANQSLRMGGFEVSDSAKTELFDCLAINERILAREQAALAELKRGMKEQGRV
jgi:hypothetical protein